MLEYIIPEQIQTYFNIKGFHPINKVLILREINNLVCISPARDDSML